ncbi:TPA: hypothetical protein DCX16_01115 [bacterium]|nr:hypothetical protein [bacterium]
MKVYILGGGPTGLAITHGLSENCDIKFVLFESEFLIGGMSKTISWGKDSRHDFGPHKIFTLDKGLMKRVKEILSEKEWLIHPKQSSIYIQKHFLPYPPSPFSLFFLYGPLVFVSMVKDYFYARVKSLFKTKSPNTFEEDLTFRFGKGLYETLFKPIALKLWGNPSKLDVKLSKSRVQNPTLFEIISKLLKMRKTSHFEALNFYYPKGGLQRVWEAIYEKTKRQGEYLLGQEVTSLSIKDNRVVTILYKDRITNKENEIIVNSDDFVFSTLPLPLLPKLLGDAVPDATKEKINKIVQLNDLILVFFKINKPSLLNECWVFVPDLEIVFHRLSEQESFDPEMTLENSIVCCEIMSNEMRPMSQYSDEWLIETAKKGLEKMGYKDFSIIEQKLIRLPASYPVFQPGFEPILKEILDELDRFSNFRTIGRQGSFNYIGTMDAMDIGYGAIEWLINEKASGEVWKKERERTNYYPVLD